MRDEPEIRPQPAVRHTPGDTFAYAHCVDCTWSVIAMPNPEAVARLARYHALSEGHIALAFTVSCMHFEREAPA